MTIALISLIWLGCLAALVWRLARRPQRVTHGGERSPRLLDDTGGQLDAAIGEILAANASEAAAAKDVGDGSQKDLYVRP